MASGNSRVEQRIILVLALAFLVYSFHPDVERSAEPVEWSDVADADLYHFDIEQHTCALEFVLRTLTPRKLDAALERWDMGTGGPLLACKPAAAGDSTRVSFPELN